MSTSTQTEIGNGIVTEQSSRSFREVVHSLETLLEQKGITLFTTVDHSGEASKVGLDMPPTKLLIFGKPAVGTPAMLASPTSALDLPLKILVAQDEQGIVNLSYNSAAYLMARHNLPDELAKRLNPAELVKSVL